MSASAGQPARRSESAFGLRPQRGLVLDGANLCAPSSAGGQMQARNRRQSAPIPSYRRHFGHSCPKWSADLAAVGNGSEERKRPRAGTSDDGARRIRTADLLGAIRGGGDGDLRKKGRICRGFRFSRGSAGEQLSRQICADMRRCDRSRELLARSSRNRGGRFKMTHIPGGSRRSRGRRRAPPNVDPALKCRPK
jgi:hypothetical protein